MRDARIVLPLLLTLLLGVTTLSFADEETPLEQPVVELSKEDQEVVEMMELLELMELLKDLENVAALEDKG